LNTFESLINQKLIELKLISLNVYLQSGEIDDMQELFELLEIKSDVWKSTKERQQAEERNRDREHLKSKTDINSNESSKHDAPSGSSHSESDSVTPSAGYSKEIQNPGDSESLSIKKENMSTSSNDEREDDDQDTENRDKECGRLTSRRRSSSNPVNLSVQRNSENTCSEHDEHSQDVDVETVGAKVIIIFYYFVAFID
jgi:hypothetical protein